MSLLLKSLRNQCFHLVDTQIALKFQDTLAGNQFGLQVFWDQRAKLRNVLLCLHLAEMVGVVHWSQQYLEDLLDWQS